MAYVVRIGGRDVQVRATSHKEAVRKARRRANGHVQRVVMVGV
jgi:hypothetical protein